MALTTVDLHMHSTCSDGLQAPAALMRACRDAGLRTVSLTDHDVVAGLAEAREACEDLGMTLIPGVELSAESGGRKVHILGYFIDPASPALLARLDGFRRERDERADHILALLADHGIRLDRAEVAAYCGAGGVLGRPHIARALVAAGHAADMVEAFDRFLSEGRPAYARRPSPSGEEQIAAIRAEGGVAVLAHPALIRNDAIVEELVDAGLQGIECFTSCHTAEETERYAALARRAGLIATGGSDYHGLPASRPLGEIPVDEGVVRALQDARS